MSSTESAPRPTIWQSLAEGRALFELISVAPARPMLKLAARGDGHPVLVLPGFFAADGSTASLRRYLESRDFAVYAWDEGRNPGISDALYQRLEQRIQDLAEQHGTTVSLVGWSLGGIYARLLAHRNPETVRQIVTLGSPFKMNQYGSVNGSVAKLYQSINPTQHRDPMLDHAETWAEPPPVPSTSIYSKGDGVAHWSFCVDDQEDEHTENIALPGSHLGMTHNPLFMYCIADRLAQAEGSWKPFQLLPQLQHMLNRALA